jgi:tyrosyl-tRNA synthetase
VSGLGAEDVERTLALGPRDAKAALARRLVERLHGPEAAARAEEDFERRFRRHEQPEEIPSFTFETGFPIRLTEAMVRSGLARSMGDARRLVQQRGVKRNGDVVTSDEVEVSDGDVIQVGKRRWVRVEVK